MAKNRAIFLDRDGVIIENIPYLKDIRGIRFMPKIVESIYRINRLGFKCVVVTNQSGVARGLISIEDVLMINKYISDYLVRHGARIDAFYFCPHHPDGSVPEYTKICDCRKPKPGMLLQASRDLDIDLSNSIMIGDQIIDYEAGRNAGCISYLVNASNRVNADITSFKSLNEAISFIEKHFGLLQKR
jgi:D-glycero-D-manno-heptose 1,7-bisphosphate phosphatase